MVYLLGRGSSHGSVAIASRAPLFLPRGIAQALPVRVRHTLPQSLAGEAIPSAAVELDVQGDYGRRRFLPAHGAEVLIQQAWALGFPFLIQDQKLDAAHRQSYRAMKLLFDLVTSGQRRIRRRLDRADELEVRGTKARRGEDRSLLPADLGLDASGHGVRWSVSRLLVEGRDQAAEAGIVNIDEETMISYGLLAAAQRNPILPVLDEHDSAAIVRQALFDEQRVTETATPEVIDEVDERFATTLCRRSRMPWERMREGMMGPKNNFAASLGRLSGANGRKLTTAQANAGLAEWGWSAHAYVAQCVDRWARHFPAAFPEELTAEERAAFNFLYRMNSHFGGLPPILMYDRLPLLEPLLDALHRDDVEPAVLGTAQRLLYYYGEIVAGRRRADRNKKRDRGAIVKAKLDGFAIEDVEDHHHHDDAHDVSDVIEAVVKRALVARGLSCPHGCPDFEAAFELATTPTETTDVAYRCSKHDWSGRVQLRLEEVLRVMNED